LNFPLRGYRTTNPVASLGGGNVRFKPVIPLTLIGPRAQLQSAVLLDSGADDIVFPTAVAARLGVNLSTALPGQAQGVGGQGPVGLLYAPLILLLSDQIETYRLRAVVAFTSPPSVFLCSASPVVWSISEPPSTLLTVKSL
jgi:hypothetical protein